MLQRFVALGWMLLLAACAREAALDHDLAAVKDRQRPADEAAPQAVDVDWPALGDCRGQLRELLRLDGRGVLPEEAGGLPFGLVVGAPVDRDRLSSPAVPIATDLPIPVNTAAARAAPCVIRVGLASDLQARRRIVGQEAIESEYQVGVRREDNPAYEIAKFKVDRAKRHAGDDDDEVWSGVGDPMMDLIGLLVGGLALSFSEGASEQELDEAMLELAKTPRKIDQPIYAPYHFDRVIVDAAKRAEIPLELLDRTRGTTARTTIRQTEQRRFHVPQSLSRRDRNYKAHIEQSITKRELSEWQRTPPKLSVSHLVASILGERRNPEPLPASDWRDPLSDHAMPDEQGDPFEQDDDQTLTTRSAGAPFRSQPQVFDDGLSDDTADLIRIEPETERSPLSADYGRPFVSSGRSLLTERLPRDTGEAALGDDDWHDPYAPRKRKPRYGQAADLTADPRFASVVMVKTEGGLGSGFYVRPDLVVTNYHVVEQANVVDLAALDGTVVAGVVIATDVGRDLALVHSPHPGRPAPLYAGPPLKPGLEVDAIGSPAGFDFTLTRGVVSAVRTHPALLTPSLQQVRYVQTDTDINPGNSGGPLFLGGDVVGVNDRGRSEVSIGLNFAIHVDELRAFLEEEGVRPLAGG